MNNCQVLADLKTICDIVKATSPETLVIVRLNGPFCLPQHCQHMS